MLYIDAANAGISGDMFIASLLDMGATLKNIENTLTPIKDVLGEYRVKAEKLKRGPYTATAYNFEFKERDISYSEAAKAIKNSSLTPRAMEFAISCFNTMTEAESKVHGVKKEKLHLHDVPDTISDIVAAAACLEELGILEEKVISSHVNTGKGFFTFHGKRSTLPAPATAEILKGVPLFGDGDFELTTPTGASILANLAASYVNGLPHMKIDKIGYGAGKHDLDFANVLKIYRGCETESQLEKDTVVVLESNIDTATGEELGYLFEKLLAEGALDVAMIPCIMKKNRPGHILKVICRSADVESITRTIMSETRTLGVRMTHEAHRHILGRETIEKTVIVKGKRYTVRFKCARNKDNTVVIEKAEYEDIKEIAMRTGLSFREVKKQIDKWSEEEKIKTENLERKRSEIRDLYGDMI